MYFYILDTEESRCIFSRRIWFVMHTRSRDQILCRAESLYILLKRDQISEQRPDI